MIDDVAPLVVFAAGQRSGSTLVQRLLCSHPRVRIWGEHVGQLRPVLTAAQTLRGWIDADRALGREALAANGYQEFVADPMPEREAIDDACRAFIQTLFAAPARAAGRPIWGFKEVRYGLSDALLLQHLFPGLRVIALVRDPRDVLRSLDDWERHPGWTRRDTEAAIRHWVGVAGSFLGGDGDLQLRPLVLSVRYEELVADPPGWTAAIAGHCRLDAALLDPGVFDNRVHAAGRGAQLPRRLREFASLPASLRALLGDPEVQSVAAAYGYDLS